MKGNAMQSLIELAHNQGVIRPRDVSSLGVDRWDIRRLVDSGVMVRTSRGLYRLADYEVTESHSLVEAVQAQSNAVICLLSALNFHGLGTQLPHQIWVAIPYGARITKKISVPMRAVVMRPPAYDAGIEDHRLEGIEVQVYGVAKTIADCFKFRNKVGLDVALEALREALRERRCSRDEILRYAKIDRIENVIRPYLEAMPT
jgi:predicted transcriptional regulator of viral defense system